MFKNYLVVAWRNLVRQKGYSAINIFGLAIGIAFCMLTFLFVRHEWSYDNFHRNKDRIYRVYRQEMKPEGATLQIQQPVPLGPALVQAFPEVTSAVRLWSWPPITLRYKDKMLKEEELVIADPDIFAMFSFPQISGDLKVALHDQYGVVISQELSRKYFGEANPIGELLTIDGIGLKGEFTVTGVVEVPANSSIRFNLLISSQNKPDWGDATKWNYNSAFTYVILNEGTLPAVLEERLHAFADEHFSLSPGNSTLLKLQPLATSHLAAGFPAGLTPTSDPAYSYILATISLAVLLIACVNFTNLSLGLVSSRYKEVGVRKVLGSTRGQLVQQFCGEAVVLTLLALLVGWLLAELSLPLFNSLVDRKLALGYDPAWIGLVGLVLAAGVLSGSYPALVLSRPQPHEVFRGRQRLRSGNWFGKGLIVVQFTLSTGLIILTLFMSQQMDFLRKRNLGYSGAQVVVVHEGYALTPEEKRRLLEMYQNTAVQYPDVADIAASSFAFDGSYAPFVTYSDEGGTLAFFSINTDARLVKTLGMELVQGRGFIEGSEKDLKESVIVNETLVRKLGWDNPIGKVLPQVQGRTVVGVVKDFHLQSLHHQIEPVVMEYKDNDSFSNLFIKVRSGALPGVLELLEKQWYQIIPYHPFEYSFLDTDMERQYRADEQWGRIVWYSAVLAIAIACLGAFGLTALNLARRTNEIGIRKVLGASVPSIVALLSKEFTYLVLAANLISWPIAWYAMHRWLESFAYRIELGPGVFVLGGVLALAIAWLTVSYQAIRAARANPVEALRYE